MDAVADGEHSVDLERFAESGKVADSRDDCLDVPSIGVSRIEGPSALGNFNPDDVSSFRSSTASLGDWDVADGALGGWATPVRPQGACGLGLS